MVMKANSRCSIRFHLLVPGGRWFTVISMPSSSARTCSSHFHRRTRLPLLPAAIGVDQQPRGRGIARGAERVPPAPDAFGGEGGGIVADAEIDPSLIGGDIVDAVWRDLAAFRDGEVMHPDRLGLSFRAELAAPILEVADQLFLLCVDRDHRFAGSLERLHLGVDVLELSVAVGMVGAFARLGIGLQTEAQTLEQTANQLLTRGEAQLSQRRGEMALALAHP